MSVDFMAKEKAKSTKTKKTTPPKKRKKRKLTKAQRKRRFKRNVWIAVAVSIGLSLFLYGYLLGVTEGKNGKRDTQAHEDYSTQNLLNDLAKIKGDKAKQKMQEKHVKVAKKQEPIVHVKKPKQEKKKVVLVKPVEVKKPTLLPTHVVTKPHNATKKKEPKMPVYSYSSKPKLVLIIDDVSTQKQLSAIVQTRMHITPSIFPPYSLAKHTNQLAIGLKHYMIHLPMESGSKQFNKQTKTLMTHFTAKQMQERVKELRRFFPHALYINNHTGSVFTANYAAMYRLYGALKAEGFLFLDSKTIGSSKVRKIARQFGDAYIARDIFIDNIHTQEAIHQQLKKAVRLAKKRGYAVAIGHPHSLTIRSIANAKDILADVELLYIDEFYAMKRK
jgi:hypothetical protein